MNFKNIYKKKKQQRNNIEKQNNKNKNQFYLNKKKKQHFKFIYKNLPNTLFLTKYLHKLNKKSNTGLFIKEPKMIDITHPISFNFKMIGEFLNNN